MTIYDLKALGTRSGGHFFTRNNMKFAKDTMKSFSFKDHKNGTATVTRKRDGTEWKFNTTTGLTIAGTTKMPTKFLRFPLHKVTCHNFAFPKA